jgi:hypothetical protein
MRGEDVGDANLFVPDCENAVVAVTVQWYRPGEAIMSIRCTDANGAHNASVSLHVESPVWSSEPRRFKRIGDWSQIVEPENLVAYCTGVYNEMANLRDR